MAETVYLGYYGDPATRRVSPACVAVMDFVADSLRTIGRSPTLLSPARPFADESDERDGCLYTVPPVETDLSRGGTVVGLGRLPARAVAYARRAKALDDALDAAVRDGDTLLVYHSLRLMRAVRRLRSRRRIRLILQVCEIYADASADRRHRAAELDYVRAADGYLFSSDLLAGTLGDGRPFAVCYGDCRPVSTGPARPSDKVHMVYAGTLDPRKGGARMAIEAAGYLPAKVHLHIAGFGTPAEVADIQGRIRAANAAGATVTYDGVLTGEAYRALLGACTVGLAVQDPDGYFNRTSFPSKILSYLGHGLQVVSSRAPAVERSAVRDAVTFCDAYTPAAVAEAVWQAMTAPRVPDPRRVTEALAADFQRQLGHLLREEALYGAP